ncbi:MAG: hypothetical protein ACI4MZ_06975 [Christensenellales bacterium]
MDYYNLAEDEVVLYKGNAQLKGKKISIVKLILTNLFVVSIHEHDEENPVEKYPTESIKIYNGKPQVIQNNETVKIYYTSGEQEFVFANKKEAQTFTNTAIELLTGKTKFERNAVSAKGKINVIDETFGINTVEEIKGAIKGIASGIKGITSDLGSLFKGRKKTN